MRFRAGDDILARIRASLVRRDHGERDRGSPGTSGWRKPVAPPDPAARPPGLPPVKRAPTTQVTYYGRLGEMGHVDDRAIDWPEADTGGDARP